MCTSVCSVGKKLDGSRMKCAHQLRDEQTVPSFIGLLRQAQIRNCASSKHLNGVWFIKAIS